MNGAIKRLIRGIVALAVTWGINELTGINDPKILALIPIINALGKYLRETYNLDWLPF
jgi:hypothetical protein